MESTTQNNNGTKPKPSTEANSSGELRLVELICSSDEGHSQSLRFYTDDEVGHWSGDGWHDLRELGKGNPDIERILTWWREYYDLQDDDDCEWAVSERWDIIDRGPIKPPVIGAIAW